MKIFTTHEIKAIDTFTIEQENIEVVDLMERASSAVACEIISRWRPNKRFFVFAGPGNNGGDALAVARMLIEQGYKLQIFLFNIPSTKMSHCCKINRDRLLEMGDIDFVEVVQEFEPPYISSDDIVIDGLFGSGLRECLTGGFKALVRMINESEAHVVSIDIPSGMFGEWNSENNRNDIIRANTTLAFQFKRLAFFFSENAEMIGECKVLDIDLSQEAIRKTPSNFYLTETDDIRRSLLKRNEFSNKHDYGSALIVAGSYGMMGAAVLASRAAMRSGAGLVNVHSPRCGYSIIQSSVPEVIFNADKNDIVTTDIRINHKYKVVAVGPGMGRNEVTIDAIDVFLKNATSPCILDADALNCIAERQSLLDSIPPMSVITPHATEFDRLFGSFFNEEMRLKKAIEISRYYKIIIVLKGRYTMIVRPDGKVCINSTGNPGMATAGSGDVLTGLIAGFAAQGYKMELSAILGVYIHGMAGDLAAAANGSYGMVASDIVDNIRKAIKTIMKE